MRYIVSLLMVVLSGCATQSAKNLNAPAELGALRHIVAPLAMSSANTIDRTASLKKLDDEYDKGKAELKEAMMFATYQQRSDYFRKKRIGVLGVLFGVTAVTLNAASAANLVWSTAFTGLQTTATGYLATDDQLVDPLSNQALTEAKKQIEVTHEAYWKTRAALDNNLDEKEWEQKYNEALSILRSLNFKAFSIVPPE